MIRWLRWYLAKKRLAYSFLRFPPRHVQSHDRRFRIEAEDLPAPNAEAYEELAAYWDDYGGWFTPRYGRFLAAAARHYCRPTQSILDLACGTGLLTREMARCAGSVVGLDASEAMLTEARSRTALDNVRYVRGDYRDFSLGETFDGAVCGGNSLNYLGTPGELAKVFGCVRSHLRSGGFFVFDAMNERAFCARAGRRIEACVRGKRFELYFFYDREARVQECLGVFKRMVEDDRGSLLKTLVERHRRVPIEKGDVQRAAADAGMVVAETFGSGLQFFLLRRLA